MIVCHPVNGVLPSMADPVAVSQVAVGRHQGQDVFEDLVRQVVDRFRSRLDICVKTMRSDVEILFFWFHFLNVNTILTHSQLFFWLKI
jgi:hypothetical protein